MRGAWPFRCLCEFGWEWLEQSEAKGVKRSFESKGLKFSFSTQSFASLKPLFWPDSDCQRNAHLQRQG